MQFADFLKYAMEQAGISKYKLAKRLDISQTTIANWLNGLNEPREKKREKVLNLFGVKEENLLEEHPKIDYKKEKPTGKNADELDEELVRLLVEMDEDGLAQVRAFAQGIAAGKATRSSEDK